MSSSHETTVVAIDKMKLPNAQWKLSLSYRLQQSLAIRTLLGIFYEALKEEIPCDYFYYGHEDMAIDYQSGRKQKHFLRYDLRMGETLLGKVAFSRRVIFDNDDIEKIEEMLSVLLYAVRNALEYQRVLEQSLYDPLTGILNRASLYPTIEKEIAYSQRQQLPLALLIVDIDHFKQINDNYGHHVGDFILCEVARYLKNKTRKSDWLFRLGGDEFLLLLPNTDKEGAMILAERFRHYIDKKTIAYQKQAVPLTLSIGVAALSESSQINTSVEALMELADQALYRAKSDGRNTVSL